MSTIADNRTKILCEIKQDKHNRWQSAVKWSDRNPPFAITFNESLVNDTSFSNRPFNISQFPFHQQCTASKAEHNKLNDTYCSVNIKPTCQLLQIYRNNLTCPFSNDGKTHEECECVGLNKNVNQMKPYDQVNCTCMHDNSRDTMTNKNSCDSNYFFTKECIIDETKVSGDNSFRLNCTFINCSSTLENEFFNATSDKNLYEPCMDYRPVRIIPHIIENRTMTTTTTTTDSTTSTATTKKTTTPPINNTTNSTVPKVNLTVANLTKLSQTRSLRSPTTTSASTPTKNSTKPTSQSVPTSTTIKKPTVTSTSNTTAKPLTSTPRITQKPTTTNTTETTTNTASISETSINVRTTSAKANQIDETRMSAVPEKNAPTYLTIPSIKELTTSFDSTSVFSLPPVKAQYSKQIDSGSLAGIMVFVFLVCSALGLAGFLIKTRKGQQLRKRLSQRLTQQ